jgi:asparagine synthase (glutamine-hydrolysing)
MCFSGEGSDEAWSGYLYNHHCPSEKALNKEAKTKCNELHLYDCLRTNKTMAAHAIECRVPFLDRKVLELAFKIPIRMRMPGFYHDENGAQMEKGILRTAFKKMLPKEICWRRKAQMSDAVGSDWIRGIKEHCASLPGGGKTEEQFYRDLYVSFGYEASTVPQGVETIACSSSVGASWCPKTLERDPSGRGCLQSFLLSKDVSP